MKPLHTPVDRVWKHLVIYGPAMVRADMWCPDDYVHELEPVGGGCIRVSVLVCSPLTLQRAEARRQALQNDADG